VKPRHVLELAEVEAALLAGRLAANRHGWRISIAAVDQAGSLMHFSRMDDASELSVRIAIAKASTAALTGIDTRTLEAAIKDNPAIITAGLVAIEGGLPIVYKSQTVGGIGVSGAQAHEDAQVAKVALMALVEKIGSD
jgi:glc operon protein GlcG